MARKYSGKKRSNKIEPSVMTLTFATPGSGAARSYIDLSQVASLVNRRFYRQGINWAVSGFKLSSLKAGNVNIFKLPNTWVTSNAWEKAFRSWNKQQMEDVEESGSESAVARFRDFKVFADVAHVANTRTLPDGTVLTGMDANLMPVDGGGAAATGGEWEPSQIVVPNVLPDGSGSDVDPIEYYLHMVGVNNNAGLSRGVLEGYADSRAYPQSPDPVSPVIGSADNWMRQMFDVGNDNVEVLTNATDKNDELPYPQVDYPGGQTQMPNLEWHDLVTIFEANPTNGLGIQRAKGGNFPCGLICVDWTPVEAANLVIQIDMVTLTHRGYLCEPMTEM